VVPAPAPMFGRVQHVAPSNTPNGGVIQRISPSESPDVGHTKVTVIGHGFQKQSDLRCNFGLKSSVAEFESSTKITCISPSLKLQTDETGRKVQLYLSGAGEISTSKTFTYHVSLLVSDVENDAVQMFDAHHGHFVQTIVKPKDGGLSNPQGVQWGVDGHIYVASSGTNQILKYNGANGQFIGVFAALTPKCMPKDMVFGPDGNLFVACYHLNKVFAYNSQSGQMLGVAAQGGGLSMPTGLAFGKGSNLYVLSSGSQKVLSFAQGGYFQGNIFRSKDANSGIAFNDGVLFVAGGQSHGNSILHVIGGQGEEFIQNFILETPVGLVFDNIGHLLVANGKNVLRFGGGSLVSSFAPLGTTMSATYMSLSPRESKIQQRGRQHTEL